MFIYQNCYCGYSAASSLNTRRWQCVICTYYYVGFGRSDSVFFSGCEMKITEIGRTLCAISQAHVSINCDLCAAAANARDNNICFSLSMVFFVFGFSFKLKVRWCVVVRLYILFVFFFLLWFFLLIFCAVYAKGLFYFEGEQKNDLDIWQKYVVHLKKKNLLNDRVSGRFIRGGFFFFLYFFG